MARTLRQIELSLADSIETQDSSIDTVKGPVFDIFIRPQAAQVRAVELLFDDLSRRYSLDYVLSQNETVLQLYGANHGLRRSLGRAARGNVTFFTYAAPGPDEIVVVPAGTVVSTTDTTISFRTLRDAFILGSSLGAFYNAAARRYEVRVPVEALGAGALFEVPQNRIIRIQSTVRGIDGVINRERISGSTEFESAARFGARIRSKFNGLALGSGDGLKQLVESYDTSSIDDVSMIFSTDIEHFRRRTRRSAWDVYIIGSVTETAEVTYVGNAVQRTFSLPLVPALAVTSVRVGSTSVGFTFLPDTTFQYRGSTQANDRVELDVIPGLNETVTITYTYDKLIRDTQTYVDRLGIQLYRADILVRKAIAVPVRVRVLVQVLSSFDETEAAGAAFASVSSFVNKEEFVSILFANDLRSQLSADVAGVSNISILEFTRDLTGTIPVETIEFKPYEYPETSDSLITIEVRR
jgi:hypothetical protein